MMKRHVEYALFAVILAIGAWLRFMRFDLLEFKGDEAMALHLASKLVHGGGPVLAGLMSSVKVTNPPLFIYLIAPLVWISSDPAFMSCAIAVLNLAAIIICWHVGRKYYGPVAGLVAALLFVVSPWAVIYSRKIWAQDLIPFFAAATLWAIHVLVLSKRPRAIFWVVFLPLCMVQIHFSGLAVCVAVGMLLLLLRPRLDWRWASAGVALAIALLVPYGLYQTQNGWADFRQAAATIGGQKYRIPAGATVDPDLGYTYPRRDSWVHALAIFNAGEIEDILGLSTRPELDTKGVWKTTRGAGAKYFSQSQHLGNWGIWLQQVAFLGAFGWLTWRAGRSLRLAKRAPFASVPDDALTRSAWILVLWIAVPVTVFLAARLWTYLSYFVILLPAQFLVMGAAVQALAARLQGTRPVRAVILALVIVPVLWNVTFVVDLYAFLSQYGGAHGTYGTVLAYKQAAARHLAERADVNQLVREQRLLQMDRLGELRRARMDLVWLAMQEPGEVTKGRLNAMVVVTDQNRASFSQRDLYDWRKPFGSLQLADANYGPMQLMFLQAPVE